MILFKRLSDKKTGKISSFITFKAFNYNLELNYIFFDEVFKGKGTVVNRKYVPIN